MSTSSPTPCSQIKDWFRSFAPLSGMPLAERMSLLKQENQWKNELVMWMFPDSVRAQLPHEVQTWLRCWILCAAVYFIVGGAWAYYTYFCFGDILFKPGTMPGQTDVFEQIKVRSPAWLCLGWLFISSASQQRPNGSAQPLQFLSLARTCDFFDNFTGQFVWVQIHSRSCFMMQVVQHQCCANAQQAQ